MKNYYNHKVKFNRKYQIIGILLILNNNKNIHKAFKIYKIK